MNKKGRYVMFFFCMRRPLKNYIRYGKGLKWEAISCFHAALWVIGEGLDDRWRLSMLTIPNNIVCNGVEIKVVGEDGEQADEGICNVVPNDYFHKRMQFEKLRSAAEATFRISKRFFWSSFSAVFRIYVYLLEIVWEMVKAFFRVMAEEWEEDVFWEAEIR